MCNPTHKNILMIVNTHVYDDPRVINEGVSLAEAGYRVSIIGAARKPQGGLPTRGEQRGLTILLAPMVTTRKLPQLLRAFADLLRGRLDDVTPPPPSRSTNIISMLLFNLWVLRLGLRMPADIIHCHDLSPLPGAWLLAKLKRTPLIYDSHENHAALYAGRKGEMTARLERLFIRKPDAVITPSEPLTKELLARGARQVVTIGNWKRLDTYDTIDPARLEAERRRLRLNDQTLKIAYLGTLNANRHIAELLQAVEKTREVTLLIGGNGAEAQLVEAAAQRAPNIHWLGWVDSGDVPVYTLLADAVYCCLNPAMYSQVNVLSPNKLYEAFAAGKALIARRGTGDTSAILEKIPAGILLDDVTPDTLQEAFSRLQDQETLKEMQQAAWQARGIYNWAAAEKHLHALYARLLDS
jgi:glycosyltransferase involved in cell wall biosynthesis